MQIRLIFFSTYFNRERFTGLSVLIICVWVCVLCVRTCVLSQGSRGAQNLEPQANESTLEGGGACEILPEGPLDLTNL